MSALCLIGILVGYAIAWAVVFSATVILTDRWFKR